MAALDNQFALEAEAVFGDTEALLTSGIKGLKLHP